MRYHEIHYSWKIHLSSTPEELWPLVSDTNRFDRDAGVPPLERIHENSPAFAGGHGHLPVEECGCLAVVPQSGTKADCPPERGLVGTGSFGVVSPKQKLPRASARGALLMMKASSSETPSAIKIASPAFEEGQAIPKKYACDGEDINPALVFQGIPSEAKSLVLIFDDPDTPRGTWNHWLLWNIKPTTPEIKENSVPEGSISGANDFGKLKYGGPCPPKGSHRYFFRIYALDTLLDLPGGSKRAVLEKAIQNHVIAQGMLMGKYSR